MNNEKKFCVYKHTCPNNKVYIGITSKKPSYRWRNGKGYEGNIHFTRAINKYEWDNITHEILYENLGENEAKNMEKYLISFYDSTNSRKGYNKTLGGDGTLGYKATEETRKKLSKSVKKAYIDNPMYRKRLSDVHKGKNNHMFGKKVSQETRKKLGEKSKANWEKNEYREKMKLRNEKMWQNEERRKKQSEFNKIAWQNEERRKKQSELFKELWKNENYRNKLIEKSKIAKQKKVICITTNKIFNSIKQAGEYYNIKSFSHIGACCKNKRKTCGKLQDGTPLKWMYYEDYLKLNENIDT